MQALQAINRFVTNQQATTFCVIAHPVVTKRTDNQTDPLTVCTADKLNKSKSKGAP